MKLTNLITGLSRVPPIFIFNFLKGCKPCVLIYSSLLRLDYIYFPIEGQYHICASYKRLPSLRNKQGTRHKINS